MLNKLLKIFKLRVSVFILNRMSREGSPTDASESESVHGVEHANALTLPTQELPPVMQQFLETLQQLMQPVLQTVNRVANQPVQQLVMQPMAEVRETEARDKTYDRLRKQGATEFEGTTDPKVAEE